MSVLMLKRIISAPISPILVFLLILIMKTFLTTTDFNQIVHSPRKPLLQPLQEIFVQRSTRQKVILSKQRTKNIFGCLCLRNLDKYKTVSKVFIFYLFAVVESEILFKKQLMSIKLQILLEKMRFTNSNIKLIRRFTVKKFTFSKKKDKDS